MNTDSMCFPSGHLRLSDFGLSRRLKRGGRAFTICGTMQYMGELSGEHPGEWNIFDGWLLIVCWLTTVDPFCVLRLRWPTSAAVPQIRVLLFPLWKKTSHPFFHHLCTKNLLFSVITSWALYFSCLVWAAPEVLSGGPYSHAADWWSLGILLFALVTGKVRSLNSTFIHSKWAFFNCVITSSLSFQYPQSSITSPCWARSEIVIMSSPSPTVPLWPYCWLRFVSSTWIAIIIVCQIYGKYLFHLLLVGAASL